MSQTAKLNGIVVDAELFELPHWFALQAGVRSGRVHVEMPFCGCRGHGAVSRLNRPFFRHFSSEGHCEYARADESAEHLFAKNEIARGIAAAGWTPSIEHGSEPGSAARWRADVMALSGDKRTAFEVQRSWQASSRYLERAARYRRASVDSLWFIASDRRGVENLTGLVPAFDLRVEFNSATVIPHGDETLEADLADFVRDWLLGIRPIIRDTEPTARDAPPAIPRGHAATAEIPNWMPQKDCPWGHTSPGMSWSSLLGVWVCMTCRHVNSWEGDGHGPVSVFADSLRHHDDEERP